ncbi:unnamed protein product [Bathycoccus prasinos]
MEGVKVAVYVVPEPVKLVSVPPPVTVTFADVKSLVDSLDRPATSHSHIRRCESTRRLARCKRQTYARIIRNKTTDPLSSRDRNRRRCGIVSPQKSIGFNVNITVTSRIRVRICSYFNRLKPFGGRRKSRGIRRSRACKTRKRPATSHSHIRRCEITRRLARCKRQTYARIIRNKTTDPLSSRDRNRRRCGIVSPQKSIGFNVNITVTSRIRVRICSYFNRLKPFGGRRKSRGIRRSRACKTRKRPATSHSHIRRCEITQPVKLVSVPPPVTVTFADVKSLVDSLDVNVKLMLASFEIKPLIPSAAVIVIVGDVVS